MAIRRTDITLAIIWDDDGVTFDPAEWYWKELIGGPERIKVMESETVEVDPSITRVDDYGIIV